MEKVGVFDTHTRVHVTFSKSGCSLFVVETIATPETGKLVTDEADKCGTEDGAW